jgi:hypothetical protein
MTFYEKATKPHLFLVYCAVAALIGGIGSIRAGTFNVIAGLEGIFVWAGLILMLWHAWMKKPTWPAMLRSKQFWLGICLIAAGNILWFEFSK